MLELPSANEVEKGLASPALTGSFATTVPPRNSLPPQGSGRIDSHPPEKVSTEETKSLGPMRPITAPQTAGQSSLKVRQPPTKSASRKTSRWIKFQLWFNTYRYVASSLDSQRKSHRLYLTVPESFLRYSCQSTSPVSYVL